MCGLISVPYFALFVLLRYMSDIAIVLYMTHMLVSHEGSSLIYDQSPQLGTAAELPEQPRLLLPATSTARSDPCMS